MNISRIILTGIFIVLLLFVFYKNDNYLGENIQEIQQTEINRFKSF